MKNFTEKEFGTGTKRRDYNKSKIELEIKNLLRIQTSDFKKFRTTGIDEAFKDIFPVTSRKDKIIIEYISSKLNIPLNYEKEIEKAKYNGENFSAKLTAKMKMTNNVTGEVQSENDIYISNIPLMTKNGSFIINGSERIVMSQIVRSPGVYFENLKTSRSQLTSNNSVFKLCTIIPSRGAWIEFDYKDYKLLGVAPADIKVKIDKSKRIKSMLLFYSFGLNDDKLREIYGKNNELLEQSIKKVKDDEKDQERARFELFKSSSDRATKRTSNEFLRNLLFDKKRYFLSESGRYKLNKKLNVSWRIKNKILAEDILDSNNKVLLKKHTKIGKNEIEIINEAYKNNNLKTIDLGLTDIYDEYIDTLVGKNLNSKEDFKNVHLVKIYNESSMKDVNDNTKVYNVIGNINNSLDCLTISDIISTFSYIFNSEDGIVNYDDIDSLSNRKILNVNEILKNQFRIGLSKIEKNMKERASIKDFTNTKIKTLINYKFMESTFKEFFNSSQLSQFMDQINPLSEISNKRKITSLGPGGISKETASLVIRGIHDTHYGKIDPIETPEGPNIGLILNFSLYAQLDDYGFIRTPYFKVENGKVNKESLNYFTVDEEEDYVIASGNTNVDDKGNIIDDDVLVRINSKFERVNKDDIDYIDVSPKQMVSIASSHIPFLENDDANRALMGANMQRQAIPLIKPESPIVATGAEEFSGKYSPTAIVSDVDGIVKYVDSTIIKIESNGKLVSYKLKKFARSNQGTAITNNSVVKVGDKVTTGQLLANGPSMDNGELSLGKNVLVAFTTWRGYNYEDAVIVSENLVKNDAFTSIHVDKLKIEQRKTKLGNEKITSQIPNASKFALRNLDSEGIITIGSHVKNGDILVGKTTPKADDDKSPEEKLLSAIIGNKIKNIKDSSLRVPYGIEGVVTNVEILSQKNGDKLDEGVLKSITIYIAKKRKIKEGDKMAGRHGNKAVISKILPVEDMPFLEDGTPIDIMLNPLGVPSRMNIGQILEIHLGIAAKKLNIKVCTPPFSGANMDDLNEIMKEANINPDGKFPFYDGITGRKFDRNVAVGIMYMLKLSHMVDDKLHARSVGPYSLITQQPLRGKSQNGGQRFGEMESWALEAYGVSNILQEMMTLKSDDIKGRNKLYNSIIRGFKLPTPSIPESFWVLFYELRGLGFSLEFLNENNETLEIDNSL